MQETKENQESSCSKSEGLKAQDEQAEKTAKEKAERREAKEQAER